METITSCILRVGRLITIFISDAEEKNQYIIIYGEFPFIYKYCLFIVSSWFLFNQLRHSMLSTQ